MCKHAGEHTHRNQKRLPPELFSRTRSDHDVEDARVNAVDRQSC
jgi:hypothetical protein